MAAVTQLQVDWLRCDGHGVCIEVAPEVFAADDWGYPVLPDGPLPARHTRLARRAAAACPAVALRLTGR